MGYPQGSEEKGFLILHLEFVVLPLTVNTVILKHVCHVLGGDEGIVNSDELNIVPLKDNSCHQTTDSSLIPILRERERREKREARNDEEGRHLSFVLSKFYTCPLRDASS